MTTPRSTILVTLFALGVFFGERLTAQNSTVRTVIATELATEFSDPNGFSWGDVGARVGIHHDISEFSAMSSLAIKVTHARFQLLKPSDDTEWCYFPYSALKAYEAHDVAAGKPPLFITAWYAGKRRNVVWDDSLGLQNGTPTTPPSEWEYAVNVQDDRYIKFWINNYVRAILWKDLAQLQTLWVGLDEGIFNLAKYGVLDDQNHFVAGVTWDAPFPQDNASFIASINIFFNHLKQLAPDINVMPDVGSPENWSDFPVALASSPGIMTEEIYFPALTDPYSRNKVRDMYTAYSWASSQGKVAVFRSEIVPGANESAGIRSSVLAYELLKGPNSFFAPRYLSSLKSILPAAYSQIQAALGNPVGSLQNQQQPGTPNPGYALYSREYEGGIVYLNMTGATKTIILPGQQYYDANGKAISQITIPDLALDYVRFRGGGSTGEKPLTNPRFAGPATAPVTVTITDPSGNGVIYYTLDGTMPYKNSAIYNGPITLSSSAVVLARDMHSDQWSSFAEQASYLITPALPEVHFVNGSNTASVGVNYYLVGLSNVSTDSVKVSYTATSAGGTSVRGTITFKPSELYQYFSLTLDTSTTVVLSSPEHAVLGKAFLIRQTVQ